MPGASNRHKAFLHVTNFLFYLRNVCKPLFKNRHKMTLELKMISISMQGKYSSSNTEPAKLFLPLTCVTYYHLKI